MVVKKLLVLIMIVTVNQGCLNKQNVAPLKDSFVQEKYQGHVPIASIEALPNFCQKDTSFTITKNTAVQIYAVGELDVSLFGIPQEYFFKSDNVELFFPDSKAPGLQKSFAFSWSEGTKVHNNTVTFIKDKASVVSSYINGTGMYTYEIAIPWQSLKVTPENETKIKFNAAVGDNDDGIKQHAKIAWKSSSGNPSSEDADLGEIVLSNIIREEKNKITSIFKKPMLPLDSTFWSKVPARILKDTLFGSVADAKDLSATIKSAWDKSTLYFHFEISDSRRGHVDQAVYSGKTFSDYGWIEDNQGKKIWEMHAMHSKHVGGALKNQGIDTIISLRPGLYTLKYVTDESHNWNDWDDKPPTSSFYGIRLYRKQ